jgi:hypothetical protein
VARHAFYNNSSFDGNNPAANAADDDAIAIDKIALRPNEQANAQHIVSFNLGLNGILIDIAGLPPEAVLTPADFEFHVGNDNDTENWSLLNELPSIDIRPGAGENQSDRVTLIWPDHTIVGQWLEVKVKNNSNTGLPTPDVFYFGALPADANGDGIVNATDFAGVRANPADFLDPANVDSLFDLNRDGRINGSDLLLVREHLTSLSTRLNLIQPPAVAPLLKTKSATAQSLIIPIEGNSGSKRVIDEQDQALFDSLSDDLLIAASNDQIRTAALTLLAATDSQVEESEAFHWAQEETDLELLDLLFA